MHTANQVNHKLRSVIEYTLVAWRLAKHTVPIIKKVPNLQKNKRKEIRTNDTKKQKQNQTNSP